MRNRDWRVVDPARRSLHSWGALDTRIRTWLPRVIALAGVALFVRALRGSDLGATLAIVGARGPLLLLGLLPFAVQMGLSAAAWGRILAMLRHPVSWARLLAVSVAAEAMLMSIPGGTAVAESFKPWMLLRDEGVPVGSSTASVAAKKTLLAFAQALYLLIALFAGAPLLVAISPAVLGREGLLALVCAAAVAMALVGAGLTLFFGSGVVAQRVRGALGAVPIAALRGWLEARRSAFTEADFALLRLRRLRPHRMLPSLVLLLAAWLVEAVETWLILRLLGVALSPQAALVTEATVVLLRHVAFFVPSGLGVQDAGYLAFLDALGVPRPAATAFILVKRAKELSWIAAGYLLLFAARFDDQPPEGRAVAAQLPAG